MKSAYERALERSGGTLNRIPEHIKEKLAEIDIVCKAKIAEAELSVQNRLAKESDPVKALEIKEALVTEIASIRDRYENQKNKIRSEA